MSRPQKVHAHRPVMKIKLRSSPRPTSGLQALTHQHLRRPGFRPPGELDVLPEAVEASRGGKKQGSAAFSKRWVCIGSSSGGGVNAVREAADSSDASGKNGQDAREAKG